MLLFRVGAILVLLALNLGACGRNNAAPAVQQLHLPGETPLLEIRNGDDQSLIIVMSCEPLSVSCEKPQLKVRSLKWSKWGAQKWEFADLDTCEGATQAFESHMKAKRLTDKDTFDALINSINPCLSKSYMNPPWERSENK